MDKGEEFKFNDNKIAHNIQWNIYKIFLDIKIQSIGYCCIFYWYGFNKLKRIIIFSLILDTMNAIKMQIETSNDDFCTDVYFVCKNIKFLLIYETTLPIILVLRGSVLKNCL